MDKFLKSLVKNEQGFVLFSTIWLIALMTLIAMGALFLSHQEYSIARTHWQAKQVYYLAEAGLEEALHLLSFNPSGQIAIDDELAGGQIQVRQTGEFPEKLSLISIGTMDQKQKELSIDLEFNFWNKDIGFPIVVDDFQLGTTGESIEIRKNLFCQGPVKIEAHCILIGNIFTLGSLEMMNNSVLQGDLYAHGMVILAEGASIIGDIYLRDMDKLQVVDSCFIDGEIKAWNGRAPIKIIGLK